MSWDGQVLLSMVDLIEQSRLAIDELIHVAGRARIETAKRGAVEDCSSRWWRGRKKLADLTGSRSNRRRPPVWERSLAAEGDFG